MAGEVARLLWGVPSLPGAGEPRGVVEQPRTFMELEGGRSAGARVVELSCLEGHCIPAWCWSAAEEWAPAVDTHH